MEVLDIKKFIRHNKGFFAVAVKHIKGFQVATIAAPCLGNMGKAAGMRDEIVYFAAYVDAGFATTIEDEEVIGWRDFFVLQDVIASCKLFFIHRMVLVGSTPYTNWIMTSGQSNGGAFLHHTDMRHIEHTHIAARNAFKDLRQAAIGLNTMVLVLPQFAAVNENDVLRASQLIKRFRRGGDADYHNIRICGGLTNGVARNTGEVGRRTVFGECNNVVGFVADDDLKVSGECGGVFYPNAKLGVGGYYNFFGRQFSPGDAAARRFCKEGIGQSQGFVLRQAQIAILGINQEQGFARR